MDEKELEKLFSNGILVDESVRNYDVPDIDALVSKLRGKNVSILDSRALHDIYSGNVSENSETYVEVLREYTGGTSASKPADWVAYFGDRFDRLKNILLNKESGGMMSISNIKNMPSGSDVKTIAMVSKMSISPIKKFMVLDIEDLTGSYRALSSVINPDLFEDQVVVIKGKKSKDAIFINDITFPDIQIRDRREYDGPDAYALFLSDIHIGSKLFAGEAFERFIAWLNGEYEEYSDISKLVKFILIVGDMVDGIGIYPDQEKELEINDVREQYNELYKFLDRIPKHIKIIISPGNHDATHIAEPQPRLDPLFSSSMYKLNNAMLLSNPYQVNLVVNGSKTNVLAYHGFSIPYYADTVPKYNKMEASDIAEIMKIHLRSRHLAPVHGSSQVIPLSRDFLVVEETPEVYVTGHIHKAMVSKYKETILVNSSCWQYQTSYQKKYGMSPEVAKVPFVNLKDKTFGMLDFLGEKPQIYKKGIKT